MLTYDQLFPLLRSTLESGISALLFGSPCVCKLLLSYDLAQEMRKTLHDIRLAQKATAELGKFVFPIMRHSHWNFFSRLVANALAGGRVWCLLTNSTRLLASFIKRWHIRLFWRNALVNFSFTWKLWSWRQETARTTMPLFMPLSSALRKRFVHFEMRSGVAILLKWTEKNGIHENIMAFIQTYMEEVLFPISDAYRFPIPCSWAMAIRGMPSAAPEDMKRVAAACIDLPIADHFFKYLEIYRKVNCCENH